MYTLFLWYFYELLEGARASTGLTLCVDVSSGE